MLSKQKLIVIIRLSLLMGLLLLSVYILMKSLGIIPNKQFGDRDLDGYINSQIGGEDCDDSNSSINPSSKDIPDDGIDQDCLGGDTTLSSLVDIKDFDKDGFEVGRDCDDASNLAYPEANEIFDFNDNDCDGSVDEGFNQLVVYEDFTIADYDTRTIVAGAKQIQTIQAIDEAYLYVEASVDNPEQQLTKYDSVYIFVDTGEHGGHLALNKSLVLNKESETLTRFVYRLNSVPLRSSNQVDEDDPKDFTHLLNTSPSHRIGAFVATQRFGILKKLILGYKFGDLRLVN